jgi:ATP-dependent DNA helicase RecG
MDDTLALTERLAAARKLGESHFREFKSAWEGPMLARTPRQPRAIAKDIGETLVAFANADGGELFVGVEDDGEVTGVPHDLGTTAALMRAPIDQVHPNTPLAEPVVRKLLVDEKLVLYFSVDKGTRQVHLTSAGRCLQRRDRSTVPAPSEQIAFARDEQASREYDRAYVDGASPADLRHEMLQRVSTDLTPGMSEEKCLQLLGLADYDQHGVRLRRAALLLFGTEVGKWHPRCSVRVLRVAGTDIGRGRDYNVTKDEMVSDNIMGLLSRGWDLVRPHLTRTRLANQGRFEEQIQYPEDACREALINAIAHRDYAIEGRNIEVFVFDDRMEIRTPGALLSTVALAGLRELRGLHESRNALIARVLRELGYMREMGEGLRRMYHVMKAHDLVPPELLAADSSFSVVLRHESAFSEADQRWLQAFEGFGLTREEKLVVLLGQNSQLISAQQIWDTLDLVDTEVYRRIVLGLQVKGLLENKVEKGVASNRARKAKKSVRTIPRFAIREPAIAEQFRLALLSAANQFRDRVVFKKEDFTALQRLLKHDNPLRTNTFWSMRALGMVDTDARPSALLRSLWAIVPASEPVARPAIGESGKASERTLIAEKPEEETELDEFPKDIPRWKVLVGNLDYRVTSTELRSLFGRFGEIQNVELPQDVSRGHGRGFAFVELKTHSDQVRAVAELEGVDLLGRPLRLGWYQVPAEPR